MRPVQMGFEARLELGQSESFEVLSES
jgi:hypothetical protein